jgi:hypothetical protein
VSPNKNNTGEGRVESGRKTEEKRSKEKKRVKQRGRERGGREKVRGEGRERGGYHDRELVEGVCCLRFLGLAWQSLDGGLCVHMEGCVNKEQLIGCGASEEKRSEYFWMKIEGGRKGGEG